MYAKLEPYLIATALWGVIIYAINSKEWTQVITIACIIAWGISMVTIVFHQWKMKSAIDVMKEIDEKKEEK